jgi:hypothetical protein
MQWRQYGQIATGGYADSNGFRDSCRFGGRLFAPDLGNGDELEGN